MKLDMKDTTVELQAALDEITSRTGLDGLVTALIVLCDTKARHFSRDDPALCQHFHKMGMIFRQAEQMIQDLPTD